MPKKQLGRVNRESHCPHLRGRRCGRNARLRRRSRRRLAARTADPVRGSVRTRRGNGYRGARARRESHQLSRTAGRGRQPAGRRRGHRNRRREGRGARRVHGDDGHHRLRREPGALSQPQTALQSSDRLHLYQPGRHRSDHPGRAAFPGHPDGGGLHRQGSGQSRNIDLRLGRLRHGQPSGRRAREGPGGRQHDPCALSLRRTVHDRRGVRRDLRAVRHGADRPPGTSEAGPWCRSPPAAPGAWRCCPTCRP